MSDAESFKVGEAPWEKQNTTEKMEAPKSFKVGEAPWETQSKEQEPERPWYSIDPKNLGPGFLKGLENIDKYTGAPIRKFVTEAATGKDFEKAPTGAEQAKMMGASDTTYKQSWGVPSYLGGDVSPADIYGVALETVQDPFLIGSGLKKIATKAAPYLMRESAPKVIANVSDRQAAKSAANSTSKVSATVSGGDLAIEQSGDLFKYKAPESLDELRQWNPPKQTGQMPGKERLAEIVQVVPDLETKPLKYHYSMMENPKSMKELKLQFENLPTEDAKKIAAYNQEIIDESVRKINQTAYDMAGMDPKSLSDSGHDFISTVKEKYKTEKSVLGPLFNEVQKKAPVLNPRDSQDLIISLGENSKIGKVLEQSKETGRFSLAPNSPRTGLSDNEHGILKRVIDDLNDGMTFEEMQKTRDFLRKSIDPTNPAASAEIGKVRSIMLGQMENMAENIDPQIGKTFKSYAINERALENIEKIIGGKIESLDSMYAANPDKIVKKVLSNPNYSKIVSEYIGPEKMNQIMSSFVQSGINKATDSAKGFAPHAFKSWLKSNLTILEANLPLESIERLNALADYGYYGKRFLDEVNPSGTAASLKAMLEPGSFVQKVKQKGITEAIVSEVTSKATSMAKQRSAINTVNEMMGKQPLKVDKIFNKTNSLVNGELLDQGAKLQKGAAVGRLLVREKENKEKGEKKWASDGYQKLNDFAKSKNNQELTDLLSALDRNDNKTKKLLIEASDFKPGSIGFQKIVDELSRMKKRGK